MKMFHRKKLAERNMLAIMAPGSYGALPVKGLKGQKEDPVFIKKRFSGFFGTGLDAYLKPHHIDTLMLAGTQTPNCVRATAFDDVSLDYRTIVLSDCTSSGSDAVQKNNLQDMRHAGIEVYSSDELPDPKFDQKTEESSVPLPLNHSTGSPVSVFFWFLSGLI